MECDEQELGECDEPSSMRIHGRQLFQCQCITGFHFISHSSTAISIIEYAHLQQPPKISVNVCVQSHARARDRPPNKISLSMRFKRSA